MCTSSVSLLVFVLFLFTACHCQANDENAEDLIQKFGYPVETYYIQTQDGYINCLHRIPSRKKTTNLKPVLIMHGLLKSSADWVGIKDALGFVLSDHGYDVWLGNARGTTRSQNHTVYQLPRDARDYFNFSWHEIGIYDVPSIIDFILNKTKHKKLFYIGHSQGCAALFVLLSTIPEYNEKIALGVMIAPAAVLANMPNSLIKQLATYQGILKVLANQFGVYELPLMREVRALAMANCKPSSMFYSVCLNGIFTISGFEDVDGLYGVDLSSVCSHFPAGASVKQMVHYGQIITARNFQHYDYGPNENMARYNSTKPLSYDWSKITAPMALFYSQNDLFVSIKDAELTSRLLPNIVYKYQVPRKKFNHFAFMYGFDAKPLVYNNIINLFSNYNS